MEEYHREQRLRDLAAVAAAEEEEAAEAARIRRRRRRAAAALEREREVGQEPESRKPSRKQQRHSHVPATGQGL